MSFPRYPSYKGSGVEWLGEVPTHWEVSSFRHCLNHMFNGLTATQMDEAENTVPVTRIETISYGVIDESKLGFINSEEARADRALVPGDILFSNINSLNMVGKCAFYPGGRTIYAGMNLLVLRPAAAKCLPLWLCWLVRSTSFRCVVESLAKPAINQASVSQSSINSITVAVPSLPEQTQIAAFLDRETAKIDALVAEQRRLMELLKEKRQAVISHAVTQGLNPHAPMKPSGIEWLGDVPAHWEVVPLKHLCVLLKDGTHLPPERVDDGIPLLSVRNLVDGEFVLREDDSMISEESYQDLSRAFVPKAEDVLLAIVGATLGKTAVISGGLGPFHIQRSVAIFRTRQDVLHSGFLNLVFQSRSFQALLWELVGYSAQPGIYLGTLQNIRIPVPPLGEQTRVLESISSATNELTGLTTEAQRAIDLLQERRTALISAAVTGQIDVRQLSPGTESRRWRDGDAGNQQAGQLAT